MNLNSSQAAFNTQSHKKPQATGEMGSGGKLRGNRLVPLQTKGAKDFTLAPLSTGFFILSKILSLLLGSETYKI